MRFLRLALLIMIALGIGACGDTGSVPVNPTDTAIVISPDPFENTLEHETIPRFGMPDFDASWTIVGDGRSLEYRWVHSRAGVDLFSYPGFTVIVRPNVTVACIFSTSIRCATTTDGIQASLAYTRVVSQSPEALYGGQLNRLPFAGSSITDSSTLLFGVAATCRTLDDDAGGFVAGWNACRLDDYGLLSSVDANADGVPEIELVSFATEVAADTFLPPVTPDTTFAMAAAVQMAP